jgi:hypothetical protein
VVKRFNWTVHAYCLMSLPNPSITMRSSAAIGTMRS